LICAKETCIGAKETYISAKETYIRDLHKRDYIHYSDVVGPLSTRSAGAGREEVLLMWC
jgi:hypothetical protein